MHDLSGKESLFPPFPEEDGGFELLTAGNYKNASEKIRYTTMLKAKVLERDVVILIASSAAGRHNAFHVFIGASRAKAKVWMLANKA